jgi:hypothetical protein
MQISREEIRSIILESFDLLTNGKESAEENISSLEIVLDELALARRFVAYKFDEADYPNASREDYAHLRELASKRLPEFDYYNIASSITEKVGEAEIHIGDAIDDVADITRDLREVA